MYVDATFVYRINIVSRTTLVYKVLSLFMNWQLIVVFQVMWHLIMIVYLLCLWDLGFLYYLKMIMYFLTNISGGTTRQMQKYVRPHCKK